VGVVRRETSTDGRDVSHAAIGALEVFRLRFPPSFRHGTVDPTRGYMAFVLEGAVCKSFRRSSATLPGGSFMSIPAGEAHSSAFGADGCTVLVIRPATSDEHRVFGPLLARRAHANAAASTFLGRQLASELERPDAYSELAVEGLALELLARAARTVARRDTCAESWLEIVRELIHEFSPRVLSLQELGAAVDRHPAHVARAFRRAHGMSVIAYARALRLEWATAAVESTDDALARVAMDAGFADQSHFTRCFKRHHGVTPGRYRELLRA
jgi:AraC family transcriptional regulator